MVENKAQDRPLNILLVEDNEADIKITKRAFSRSKVKSNIFVAGDGQDALDFIRHEGRYLEEKHPRPDLILLDIKMPKMDGFEVLKKLKEDIQYNFIPVIMLTSSKEEEDVVRSYQDGAASFIQKPVNYDEFVKIVEGFYAYWCKINKLPNPDMLKE